MARPRKGRMLAGGKRPRLQKPSKLQASTATKQRRFLQHLAESCNIEASCRAAGMNNTSSVYRWRMNSAEFRARWALALREGYAKLELMLLERAINGTVKTVEKAGGAVDRTHEYPNALALALLRMHRDSVAATEAEHTPEEIEEVRERVLRKLAAVRKEVQAARASRPEDGSAR